MDRFNAAQARLTAAFATLDAEIARQRDQQRAHADQIAEFGLLQTDRARLALEIENFRLRAGRLEDANRAAAGRYARAAGILREILREDDILDQAAAAAQDGDPIDDDVDDPLDAPLDNPLDAPLDVALDDPLDEARDEAQDDASDQTLDQGLDQILDELSPDGASPAEDGAADEERSDSGAADHQPPAPGAAPPAPKAGEP